MKNLIVTLVLAVGLAMAAPLVPNAEAQPFQYVTGDLMSGPATLPFYTNSAPGILTLTNPVIISVPQGSAGLSVYPNIFFTNTASTSNIVFQFATSPWTNSPQLGQGPVLGSTNFSTQTNIQFAVPLSAATNSIGNIIGYGVILPTNWGGARKIILNAIYNYATNGQGQASPSTYEPTVSNCWFSAMPPAPK